MRRMLKELAFDMRALGAHMLAIPAIALLFVLLTIPFQARLCALEQQNTITLFTLELAFPFMGGYASIALMRDVLDAEGGEILFTYNKPLVYWGWIRQARLFVLFGLMMAGVCACTACILQESFADIFIVAIMQCFAAMGVAFFGVCLMRRTDGGLIVLAAFLAVQLILGREYPSLNWIYSFSGQVVDAHQRSGILFNCAIIGGASWMLGQIWVRP